MLDPKSTWLPILQCLLSLQSYGIVDIIYLCCCFSFSKCYIVFYYFFEILYSDHLRKVLDNSDLNLATEMHLLLNSSTGTIGHFRNLIMGEINMVFYWFIYN